mmetsp:Transcript_31153/g.38482  ORF Transcript_31153/g.38482 Transcript_31153/m.38482 type:complete len:85 (+) Transcript_31153:389-643(+)
MGSLTLLSKHAVGSELYEIRVTESAGRGLFAKKSISSGTLLHMAPCIKVPKEEYEKHCRHSFRALFIQLFQWRYAFSIRYRKSV